MTYVVYFEIWQFCIFFIFFGLFYEGENSWFEIQLLEKKKKSALTIQDSHRKWKLVIFIFQLIDGFFFPFLNQ